MKNNATCPVELITVSESQPRIVAAEVIVLCILFVWLRSWIIPAFLLIDFFFRAFKYEKYSWLAGSAKLIIKKFDIGGKKTDIAPKRFAATLGFGILFIVLILDFLGEILLSVYVIIVLLFFAVLESALGLCVGCKIYQWIHYLRQRR